ncbi:RraA family protein [Fodinicurvata sp. EGI_FJ10296]|uniref:RraA family protein n=1 Tax=Fodinicurvata sp. EGI_FJ10296 TaxID=3231908 RepID=UPI003454B49D
MIESNGRPGFRIVARQAPVAPDAIRTLAALPVANIGDAMGRCNIMDPEIKPLDPSIRVAGHAVTVSVRNGDNLMVHAAIMVAEPGDIIVIDGQGDVSFGIIGDLIVRAAHKKGIGGVVVDGACRDAEDIRRCGFPMFPRGINPRGGTRSGPGEINVPVACGGLIVNPGDVIVGDGDGVAVVPGARATEIAAAAQAKADQEKDRMAEIDGGGLYPAWLEDALREKGLLP